MPKPSSAPKKTAVSGDLNDEQVERFTRGFNSVAKGGKVPYESLIDAVEALKEDYTEEDIYDATISMGREFEPLDLEGFLDLMKFMKDPNFVLDAFNTLDAGKRGTIGDEELRYVLEEMGSNLKPEEIEEVINNNEYKKDDKINYTTYVDYWVEQ
jgi:Ca2+-binding EF-hand superfamily protein